MSAEVRKQQIVQVALETIREHGMHGATMSRIASGVGVTQAAIYTHFESRQRLLLAALDFVFEKIFALHKESTGGDAIQRLRTLAKRHRDLMAASGDSIYAQPLFEFIAAASDNDIREALRLKETQTTAAIAAIIEEGKREGSIARNVDAERIAWMLVASAWGMDAGHLIGVEAFQEGTIGEQLVELILSSIATIPPSAAQSGVADWCRDGDTPETGSQSDVVRGGATRAPVSYKRLRRLARSQARVKRRYRR